MAMLELNTAGCLHLLAIFIFNFLGHYPHMGMFFNCRVSLPADLARRSPHGVASPEVGSWEFNLLCMV